MKYEYIPGASPAGQGSRPVRQSNIELLRIVAMLLVLTVHADFLALGAPDGAAFHSAPVATSMRVWVQGLALVCVDVFVMISGYFGIRPSVRGVANFAFQIMFWRIVIAAVAAAAGWASFGVIAKNMLPFTGDWFSPCYMLLMLLAPALNAFIDKCDAKAMRRYLCVFFGLQLVFGWLPSTVYAGGYSLISMIGLYLLGRYIKLHVGADRLASFGVRRPLIAYFAITSVNAMACVAGVQLFSGTKIANAAYNLFMAYSSPLNIAASAALLVAFANIRLTSKAVNGLAKSAYSVMLIHLNPLLLGFYLGAWQWVVDVWGLDMWFVLLLPGIVAVYLGCTLADRVRIYLWELIMFYWHKQDKAVKNL